MKFHSIDTSSSEEFIAEATQLLEQALSGDQPKTLGLSGGSTPGPVYEKLGRSTIIDWSKISLFLVDERHVPSIHPDSNQRLIRETILAHAALPEEQIVFPDTSLQENECVVQYEMQLRSLLKGRSANIVVLGMGEDGHIASLFPPLTHEAFGNHLAIATTTDQFSVSHRISVTIPVLQHAASRLLLLRGEKKRHLLEKMLKGKPDPRQWPAQALLDERTTIILGP